ncbi:uncharacterized protein LOC131662771 [Phymastichus coffea]|uniref:uncharacterized protein LOC131662771 n=1 Tax=Phymastichus coffea TaxID=108790 RepID=UPI00273B78B1|nr:uncharacterized protein LOC131662771 [Phymastichus coffea]
MPTCYAKGCKNSSAKGVKMSCFPKNSIRRELWTDICKKFGAKTYMLPNDHSVLCEYHFTADMWEKPKVDGKKKLKPDAVPTIFGHSVFQVKKKKRMVAPPQINYLNTIMVRTNPHTKDLQIWSKSGQHYKILLVNRPTNKSMITADKSKDLDTKENEEVSIIEEKNTSLLSNSNAISYYIKDETSEVTKNTDIPNDPVSNCKLLKDDDSDSDSFIDKNFEPITDDEIEVTEEDYENFEPVTDEEINFNEDNNLPMKEKNINPNMNTEEHRVHLLPKHLNQFSCKTTDAKCSRCEKFEKALQNSEKMRIMMKNNHKMTRRSLKSKIQLLENKIKVLETNYIGLRKILNEDQINFLGKGTKRRYKWSQETLLKANEYKLALGRKGYQLLLDYKWPLPTIRTIRANLEKKKVVKNESSSHPDSV